MIGSQPYLCGGWLVPYTDEQLAEATKESNKRQMKLAWEQASPEARQLTLSRGFDPETLT